MTSVPFGQHKGKSLEAVPDKYLQWLAGLDNLREPFRTAVANEAKRRAKQLPSAAPSASATPRAKLLYEIIETGVRVLSSKIAIDGSEAAKKVELDAAAAWLRRKVSS